MNIKKLTIISIVIIIVIPLSSMTSVVSENIHIRGNLEQKKWTLMFYGDGDWLGGWALTDFLIQHGISSSENIDIVVLEDVPDGPAKLWYIDNNSSRVLLEEKGEINMGAYETLRDFISYSKIKFTPFQCTIKAFLCKVYKRDLLSSLCSTEKT